MQNPETMIVSNKNGDVIVNVEDFDPTVFDLKPGEPVPELITTKFGVSQAPEVKPKKSSKKEAAKPAEFDRAAVESFLTLMGVAFEADATDEKLIELKTEFEAKIAAGNQGE